MKSSHLELVHHRRASTYGNPQSRFTPRQREIWRLIKRGLTGAAIARALGVSTAFISRQRVACNYRSAIR